MRYRFAGFTYDADRVELRRGDAPIELQPKPLAFLRVLLENGGRALAKHELLDALWPGVVVEEGSLQRVVSLARRALDDDGAIVRTVRGVGYRLDASVALERDDFPPAAKPQALAGPRLEQEIRYCSTADGVRLAWSEVGTGPPIVRSLGWFTNLESEWRWEEGRRFWEAIARRHRLIRFDGRGIGLSDPCERFSAQTRLLDLEAVIDAAGLDRCVVLGLSEGCSSAVRYATKHPARVSRLVLYGPTPVAVGESHEEEKQRWRTLSEMVRSGWNDASPVYRQFFASLFLGADADPCLLRYFSEMQRASASADTARRVIKSLEDSDVQAEAGRVKTPTLVLHRRGDIICPFRSGRKLAALIPGARFVPLEGDNHWMVSNAAGAEDFIAAIDEFLAA